MENILEEGITVRELAQRCQENSVPLKYYPPSYWFKNQEWIIKGFEVNKIKVWFPKDLRTSKDELNKEKLKNMKLKEMVMYNDEKAYFLVE